MSVVSSHQAQACILSPLPPSHSLAWNPFLSRARDPCFLPCLSTLWGVFFHAGPGLSPQDLQC